MKEHLIHTESMKMLESFADDIFAIAAALLVVEIRIPDIAGISSHQLL